MYVDLYSCTITNTDCCVKWFLGLAEAGLFPGINYYLSCWYKRSEFGIRAAIFFSAAAVSGSFGGLLAAAIGKMNGLGGRPGWAWIFILEGIVSFPPLLQCQQFPSEIGECTDDESRYSSLFSSALLPSGLSMISLMMQHSSLNKTENELFDV